jgi:penicillin-binding protein 1A
MNSILRSVLIEGSARAVKRAIDRDDLAGKTGTTNDQKDLWFSGFNGNIVTTVYVGYDQPQNLGSSEQAATVSIPIWVDFMKTVLEGTEEISMKQPDGLVTVRINRETGLLAMPDEDDTIFEVFRAEDLPAYPNTPSSNDAKSDSREAAGTLF